MKICIPSKGRAQTMTTHLFFDPAEVLIFVEPQEFSEYQAAWPEYTFIDIGTTNLGISTVRNFILSFLPETLFLMVDDDIEYFVKRTEDGHYSKLTNILSMIDDLRKRMITSTSAISALVSLNISPFSFFTNELLGDETSRTNSDVLTACYVFNTSIMKCRFDTTFTDGEDVDLMLQLISTGFDVEMNYQYAFRQLLRSPGGLTEIRNEQQLYSAKDCSMSAANSLLLKWGPDIISVHTDKYGNFKKLKINFANIKSLRNR